MADHPIPTAALHRWVVDFWRAAGSSDREATLTADNLVGANLAGHDSHGVGMIPRYTQALLAGELRLNQTIAIAVDHGTLLTIDGQRGMGQSIGEQAMAIGIERARRDGCCVMGLRHSHHLGRIGHWAEQATRAGLISIHFTNALSLGASVAPHFGAQGRFLTNPFTVGIPHGERPIVLDFATSAIAAGKVRVAYNKRVPAPPGCLIDADGLPTQDPAVLIHPEPGRAGALLTFAEHKGYALAMVCELLGAALTGGETFRKEHLTDQYAIWNNMLTLLFDPARIGEGTQAFEAEAHRFIDWVKSSRLRPGETRILMPGDPERIAARERATLMPVDTNTLDQLDRAAESIGRRTGQTPGPLSALERGC